jgi:hypothetical protein
MRIRRSKRRSEEPSHANVVPPSTPDVDADAKQHRPDKGVADRAEAYVGPQRGVADVIERRPVLQPAANEDRAAQEIRQPPDAAQIPECEDAVVVAAKLAGA